MRRGSRSVQPDLLAECLVVPAESESASCASWAMGCRRPPAVERSEILSI